MVPPSWCYLLVGCCSTPLLPCSVMEMGVIYYWHSAHTITKTRSWGTHHKTWLLISINCLNHKAHDSYVLPSAVHACHALRKCARAHQTDLDKLIPLLHCCLGDPWAGVGLVLILKTAKHLC
ncbi:hypothetical protein V8C86DRAFT_2761962, partial [Haematococcus lacustris]